MFKCARVLACTSQREVLLACVLVCPGGVCVCMCVCVYVCVCVCMCVIREETAIKHHDEQGGVRLNHESY